MFVSTYKNIILRPYPFLGGRKHCYYLLYKIVYNNAHVLTSNGWTCVSFCESKFLSTSETATLIKCSIRRLNMLIIMS